MLYVTKSVSCPVMGNCSRANSESCVRCLRNANHMDDYFEPVPYQRPYRWWYPDYGPHWGYLITCGDSTSIATGTSTSSSYTDNFAAKTE